MIHVVNPGLLTTVQDVGRTGYQRYGVVVSGAMDAVALQVGNILVGNFVHQAGLEMSMLGPKLQFVDDALIAVTGRGLIPMMNRHELPVWRQVFIKAGETLEFKPSGKGCRSYLCVAGGIDVQQVMGSRSTYLRAGIGGFQGRALKEGDSLAVGYPSKFGIASMSRLSTEAPYDYASWQPAWDVLPAYRDNPVVRIVAGNQMNLFSDHSLAALESDGFAVTSQSDRMGYRLRGQPLKTTEPVELISEAVTMGTIQVPPNGNPIILMADRQTTGGYPKIAHVATVDLPVVAQLQPGDLVGFQFISLEQARQSLRKQQHGIESLERGLHIVWRD